MSKNIFPLKDGQKAVLTGSMREQTVMGEIKPPHDEPVCWTLQGNWYRRSDGEPMTGAGGRVMTVKEFYQLRKQGKFDY